MSKKKLKFKKISLKIVKIINKLKSFYKANNNLIEF
jgi:hypothetical protein